MKPERSTRLEYLSYQAILVALIVIVAGIALVAFSAAVAFANWLV